MDREKSVPWIGPGEDVLIRCDVDVDGRILDSDFTRCSGDTAHSSKHHDAHSRQHRSSPQLRRVLVRRPPVHSLSNRVAGHGGSGLFGGTRDSAVHRNRSLDSQRERIHQYSETEVEFHCCQVIIGDAIVWWRAWVLWTDHRVILTIWITLVLATTGTLFVYVIAVYSY